MSMIRKNYLIRQDQIDFLSTLQGNDSEHIRRAIDEYIQRIRSRQSSATTSPSKRVSK